MSTFRMWAFWRRLQYGVGFMSFWLLTAVLVYVTQIYVPPNCFDRQQNGDEGGIDCDGSCVRICAASVIEPKVVWVDSFRIIDGQYNAVAYIENRNVVAATPAMRYTFKLYDQGSLIASQSGVTILPPNSVYPIFGGRIKTENGRVPTETVIELEPAELWLPATAGREQFKIADLKLEDTDTRPRLLAAIENTELTKADSVEVVATIFDRSGKPLTASQTFIDSIPPRRSQEVVFTWPNSIAKTVRSCEIPSDIMLVLDRSGSMAADGGVPPEPLESAKQAAQRFVTQVGSSNLLGFLSYATTPTNPIEQPLSANKQTVTSAIAAVAMGEDGVQYTNMGDAIKAAQTELLSERHRADARKVIIFLTDGDVTRPVDPVTGLADRAYAATYALEAASAAKAQDTTIYTIGFGELLNSTSSDATKRDVELIRSLASGPEFYFEAPTSADLANVYQKITGGLCEEGPTRIEVIAKTSTNFATLE